MSGLIPNEINQIKEEMLGCGSFVWNAEDKEIIQCSNQLYVILEMEDNNAMTVDRFKSLVYGEDYDEVFEAYVYNVSAAKNQFDITHHIVTGSGKIKKITLRIRCFYDEDRNLSEMVGICIDLSFNHMRDYTTRLNNEKFYRLFGDAPIGIALLRMDGTSFLCNDSFVKSVHFKEFELKDLPFNTLIADEDQHSFMNMYQSLIEGKVQSFRNEFQMINKDDEKVWHDMTLSSVKDIYGNIKYLIAMIQPSQRNKKFSTRKGMINSIREELNDLSLKDSVSGLYTRQYVLQRLKELIMIFYEKNLSFASLLIDVDHIKRINENYGHKCGDKVIHDLSEIFKSVTRETDICARWGGEEFILLFPEMDRETATTLADRLRNEIRHTIMMWEGKEIQLTVSVAVTTYTSDDTLKTFISKVDKALYQEKKTQRDTTRVI